MRSVSQILEWGASRLRPLVKERALFEARLLLAETSGCAEVDLIANVNSRLQISEEQVKRYEALVERRMRAEPMAYLLGKKEFFGLEFKVGPGVLIPRPETESLIECVLKEVPQLSSPKILDLCTGSACIGISIVKHSAARVIGLDRSVEALCFAELNRAKLLTPSEQNRLSFMKADLFDGPESLGLSGPFEIMVSNPPYIPSEEMSELQADIKNYEPKDALDGGPQGLRFYEGIAKLWWPNCQHLLALETHDASQRVLIRKFFADAARIEEVGPHLLVFR